MSHAPGGSCGHEPNTQEAPHWSEPGQRKAEVGVAMTMPHSVFNKNWRGTDRVVAGLVNLLKFAVGGFIPVRGNYVLFRDKGRYDGRICEVKSQETCQSEPTWLEPLCA